MTSLQDLTSTARAAEFLAVVSTLRPDLTIQSSVVNAGVVQHPASGDDVVGFVTYGKTKIANLRDRPQIAITFRAGIEWVSAEGDSELIGPDDLHAHVDADSLRLLLREIFTAADGHHDDWDDYDRTMAEQRRTAVLIRATRIYSN
jgi:PPOX class probable F420-dependent enzyme